MHAGSRRREALFIDTNLLLVLLVGALDPGQVGRFKRTKAYSRNDYELLLAFIGEFERMLTTPSILTEVSNLAGQLAEPLRQRAFLTLRALTNETLDEQFRPSRELMLDPSFPVLGLADASVIAAADTTVTVLTDDFPLYQRLSSAGIDAVNFQHLRAGSWR